MLVRIVGIIVLALVGLAGVVAFNTLTYTSQQVEVDPVEPYAFNVDAAAERLAKSVTFKTVSHQDPADFQPKPFRGFIDFVKKAYPRVHQKLTLEMVGEYSLLYTWQGSQPDLDPVVLLAHYDVVPVAPGTEELWIRDAYEEIIEEGFIWGRGTMDDKVNVLGILEAVEMLLAEDFQPTRTFILAFGHDEEIGGDDGAVKMAALLKERGVRAHYVLDEGGAITTGVMSGLDRPVATIGIAEKGYVSVELMVKAEGGHSSQPPKETAVGILAAAIDRLQNNQMPAEIVGVSEMMLDHVGPEMSGAQRMVMANLWLFEPLVVNIFEGSKATNAMIRTTTAPTIFHAGVKENVLPAQARGVVNFRILPGDSVDSILEHIDRVVDDERVAVETLGWASGATNVSSPESEGFSLVEKTVKQVFPDVIVTPYLVIGGTDARHYEIISDNVFRFTPMIMNSEDLARFHGVNERIGVENYGDIIRFFRQLILNSEK